MHSVGPRSYLFIFFKNNHPLYLAISLSFFHLSFPSSLPFDSQRDAKICAAQALRLWKQSQKAGVPLPCEYEDTARLLETLSSSSSSGGGVKDAVGVGPPLVVTSEGGRGAEEGGGDKELFSISKTQAVAVGGGERALPTTVCCILQ